MAGIYLGFKPNPDQPLQSALMLLLLHSLEFKNSSLEVKTECASFSNHTALPPFQQTVLFRAKHHASLWFCPVALYFQICIFNSRRAWCYAIHLLGPNLQMGKHEVIPKKYMCILNFFLASSSFIVCKHLGSADTVICRYVSRVLQVDMRHWLNKSPSQ